MLELVFLLFDIVIKIIYFCAGAVVFIVLLTADFATKNLDTKAIRVYALCLFVIWCWLYSKLIVL
jgi:hypothetical protein